MATTLQVIMSAKNQVSPVLRQIQADVKSLDQSVGQLNKLATLNLGLAGFEAALGTIKAISDAVGEASKAGAGFDRLSSSFNELAASYGSSGQSIVTAIESVTQGTLSQATIMQQANNAMLLGVADSADEFETLAKIAVDRGRAMGISMEYAFESIVKGVGRLSPLILDNLGIVLDADKTYAQYAATIGKTADALSDAEKRQALLARLKEEVSDFDTTTVMDAAASWERFGASMTGAVAAAGDWINNNTGLVASLQDVANQLDMISGLISDNPLVQSKGRGVEMNLLEEEIKKFEGLIAAEEQILQRSDSNKQVAQAYIDGWTRIVQGYKQQLAELVAAQREADMAAANATGWWRTATTGADVQAKALSSLEAEYSKISDVVVNKYAKALDITKEEALQSITAVVNMKGSWEAAIPAIEAAANVAIAAAQKIAQANALLNSSISSIQGAALQAYSDSGYNPAIIQQFQNTQIQAEALRSTVENMDPTEASFYMRQFTDQASEGFKAVSEYANQTEKAIGGSGSATKQLTKEFQSLSGIVGGLMDTARSDFGGADLSEFLPYQDAPAEDARRIASVMVEGWDSEWAEYFKNKFPDLFSKYMGLAGGDIQKASALLLKDFQDGMNPELLDKNKIKEIAKRMFLADEATSKMVDEIARDLASEMGISIEQATAAVGGAAGVKKKPMTREEIEKLFGGVDMAPKWDMSGGKEKFKAAGIAAGVFDQEGRLLVDVGINVSATGDDAIKKALTAQITITGASFTDKQQILDWLESEMTTIMNILPVASDLFAWRMEELIKPLVGSAALTVFPVSAEDSVWIAYYDTLRARWGQFGIEVVPTSTNNEANPFTGLKTTFESTLGDPEFVNTAMFNMAANMGLYIYSNPDNYTWLGAYIGILMNQGFESKDIGQLIANTISVQLGQAQRTFEIAAANSGKAWGDAFLSTVKTNVPMELINILTDLITPQVQKKSADSKERGGAE